MCSGPDHFDCNVEHDRKPDPRDPVIAREQLRDVSREQRHEGDRDRQADRQHPDLTLRGTGNSKDIVERHGHIRDNDLHQRSAEAHTSSWRQRSPGTPPAKAGSGAGSLISRYIFQHTHSSRMPPASVSPTIVRSCVATTANRIRNTTAPATPQKMTRTRSAGWTRDAAMPTTMALSPAKTKS